MNKFKFKFGFPQTQAVRGEERSLTANGFLGNLVTMERFTRPQRAFCVKQFYLNNGSPILVRHLFCIEIMFLYTVHNCRFNYEMGKKIGRDGIDTKYEKTDG